ncbi:hypothetical protein ACFE04_005160 [Oxalis oulophora]
MVSETIMNQANSNQFFKKSQIDESLTNAGQPESSRPPRPPRPPRYSSSTTTTEGNNRKVVKWSVNKRSKSKAGVVGSRIYLDPVTGKQTLHPGTSSERVIVPARNARTRNGASSSKELASTAPERSTHIFINRPNIRSVSQTTTNISAAASTPAGKGNSAVSTASNTTRKGKEKVHAEKDAVKSRFGKSHK